MANKFKPHRMEKFVYLGVEPKIGGFYPPKWMVKIMQKPIKMDDLVVPLFLETPIYQYTNDCFL